MPRELTSSELETFPSLDWTDIAPRLKFALRTSLEKVLETQNGADLSLEESYALANSEGDDLLGLLVAANTLRAELAGNIVTYVVNRNINFTNICVVGCAFCGFGQGKRSPDAYEVSEEDFAARIRQGARELELPPPTDLTIEGWWDQAKTLEDE